jgi:DNA polymerase III alpha subunit
MLDSFPALSIKSKMELRPDGTYNCDTLQSVIDCMLDGVPANKIHSSIPEVETFNRKVSDANEFAKNDLIPASFDWLIPEYYKNLDVYSYVLTKLDQFLPTTDSRYQKYFDRTSFELEYFEDSNSMDFLKCVIYIVETMTLKNMFWGVGRGSSCASLVLYLVGLHQIDPIKYEIPEKEFFKPFSDHK